MNNISQISIFDYSEIENLGDLEKLKIFFENIEDDELCKTIETERKNGRETEKRGCWESAGVREEVEILQETG